MKVRAWSIGAIVLAGAVLNAENGFAKTVIVGPPDCQPTIRLHFATIQAAVDAAASGDIVRVCAGVYPEQVVIRKAIRVKGIAYQNGGAVVITLPSAGLANIALAQSGVVAAQVVVYNTNAELINLTIDGTGMPCATDIGANVTAGVLFAHTKGLIRSSVVRNQVNGCTLGHGILAEHSQVRINSNSIRFVDLGSIRQYGGTSEVLNNFIERGAAGVWLTNISGSAIAAEETVQDETTQLAELDATVVTEGYIVETADLALTMTLTDTQRGSLVRNNTIAEAYTGIYLDSAAYVDVRNNRIGAWVGQGVWITNGSHGNHVESNRIYSNFYGMLVDAGSADNKLHRNSIVYSQWVGIASTFTGGGNHFSQNTVNEGWVGIWDNNTADTFDSNNLLNVTILTTGDPWSEPNRPF